MPKQRTSEEIKKDNVRRPKVTRSFKLGDKWFNKDGSAYDGLGKIQPGMNSPWLLNFPSTKKELMRCNQATKRRLFIIHVYLVSNLLYDINIFYMVSYSEILEIWNVYGRLGTYMGDLECYMGDFEYIITNLVLLNYF